MQFVIEEQPFNIMNFMFSGTGLFLMGGIFLYMCYKSVLPKLEEAQMAPEGTQWYFGLIIEIKHIQQSKCFVTFLYWFNSLEILLLHFLLRQFLIARLADKNIAVVLNPSTGSNQRTSKSTHVTNRPKIILRKFFFMKLVSYRTAMFVER